MTSLAYVGYVTLHEQFKQHLAAFQSHRLEREGNGKDPLGRIQPNWSIYEVNGMFALVNQERTARGKPPIGIEAVWMADTAAAGHWDYSAKFALYCVELVEA